MNSYSGKKKLKRASCIALVGAILAFWGNSAFAQSRIIPDKTMGNENSRVRTNVNIKNIPSEVIEGGAQRGANLFHSFSEFNISEGRGAYFANPKGIANILSRVTGANPSEILGTLGVLGGSANLFLINPNGIIFGENARLDVAGSFVGTTANEVRLGETGLFSASKPQKSNLLTVNPSALFFNAMAAGKIINQSQAFGIGGETNSVGLPVGLQVPIGQTLALVGGDVVLDGGNLTAAGGRIELGSVAGNEEVSLSQSGKSWEFEYDESNTFRNIRLDGAFVDSSGEDGGGIQLQGRNIILSDNSFISANTMGEQNGASILIKAEQLVLEDGSRLTNDVLGAGNGGNLLIDTDELSVTDGAIVSASTFGGGDGGNLLIDTNELSVTDGAIVSASTFGEGDAGNLTVNAQTIEVKGNTSADEDRPSILSTITRSTGKGGNLLIDTKELSITDGAQVTVGTDGEENAGTLAVNAQTIKVIGTSADNDSPSSLSTITRSMGKGGNLLIDTKELSITDGAQVSAGTRGEGNAGNLTVNARTIEVIGTSANIDFPSGLFNPTSAIGKGGSVWINTEQLSVAEGAVVSTSSFGEGNAGNLTVNAQTIEIIGTSADSKYASSLSTSVNSGATGKGGDLWINTEQLSVAEGAQVNASTAGEGNAGNLTVNAQTIEVIGTSANEEISSGFFTQVVDSKATGKGGDIWIDTKQFSIKDGAKVSARTFGKGNAGNLTITTERLTLQNQGKLEVSGQEDFNSGNLTITADNITLDNQSSIVADTESGNTGNIILNIQDLLTLRRESQIRTNATGTATGGNITINAPDGFIIAVPEENSDISANATQARGGQVFIDATNLFGIEPREEPTSESDITATSELGSEFSGTVEINTPDIDPNRGLIQLPTQPLETEVAQACAPGSLGQSEFFITGRGGLPPDPNETLSGDAIGVDLVNLNSDATEEIEGHGDRETRRRGEDLELTMRSYYPSQVPHQIIEAQGIIVDENGDVVLVASVPNTASSSSWQNQPDCYEK